MNKAASSHDETADFLRRFRRALAALPADIREDLVEELRSHMDERATQGRLDLNRDFGSPEDYASRFITEQTLSAAVDEGRPWRLLAVLLGGVRTTAVTVLIVLPLAVAQFSAVVLMLTGLLKPISSDHIGVFFRSDGAFGGMGWVSDSASMHESLGYAAMPLFILAGLLLFFISNKLLLKAARRELTQMRSNRVSRAKNIRPHLMS